MPTPINTLTRALFPPATPPAGPTQTPWQSPLVVIGGPCVLEDDATNHQIAACLTEACREQGMLYVFKASFDKANRSSLGSARGPGLQAGCERIKAVGEAFGVPTTTDIHEPAHAAAAAECVDILQIPAFLSRQTDLLAAAGKTGKVVNIKKGQFMAPAEMNGAIEKVRAAGAGGVMLTERGTFFGYHRLVNDFVGIGDMIQSGQSTGVPVCFDVTHSTQLPGAEGSGSGGRPDRAPLLARAAVAAGVQAVFLECHPEPSKASSDRSTSMRLDAVPALLASLAAIRRALASVPNG
ncbi:MAG: 3-deoxy-8-phosphooctulonate synthase [Planctomycetota bacterium]|nr:3-deoxy-8-phosphooctulonate synthase [Planctomycetota bacterium]MDA1106414.1 3-deoxy-8-phosphooctulonate synthase [Planctomycetota bacterium]